ncbi:SDR family NAD(P)-dependent oxidoreductase [Streptomyces inhibens]|uniref:SDR family NAD(P)-dependent oxidoreductase n=1 Tax=Streptomyces inhibens TaxID=2293571 RepID=UPI001FD48E1C|nr:SDR family NAD(P)-dependent oxidoreductase [Streptomyces inhibens]
MVIGASAGIGLETARHVRAGGGRVVLVGRNPEQVQQAAFELHPLGTAAFDATDADRLKQFFQDLPGLVNHVMVAVGSPSYMPLESIDLTAARREFDQRLAMTLGVALYSRDEVRAWGTLRSWAAPAVGAPASAWPSCPPSPRLCPPSPQTWRSNRRQSG